MQHSPLLCHMVHHPPLVAYLHAQEMLLNGGTTCVHHELYQNTVKCQSVIVVKYAHTSILLKEISPAKL